MWTKAYAAQWKSNYCAEKASILVNNLPAELKVDKVRYYTQQTDVLCQIIEIGGNGEISLSCTVTVQERLRSKIPVCV